jgi:hypothetical protein
VTIDDGAREFSSPARQFEPVRLELDAIDLSVCARNLRDALPVAPRKDISVLLAGDLAMNEWMEKHVDSFPAV